MTEVRRYWDAVRRWLWLVAVATLVAAVGAWALSRTLTPIYRATATLLINQAQNNSGISNINDIMTSERLARTYGELMKKRPVIDQVIEDLQLRGSYEQVAAMVDVRPVRDTQLLTLTVDSADPQLAADIANTVARVFIARIAQEQLGQTSATKEVLQRQLIDLERQIKSTSESMEQLRRSEPTSSRLSLMQSDLGQAQATYAQLLRSQQDMALAEAKALNTVRLAQQAVQPLAPFRPNVFRYVLIAAMGAFVLAIGVAFGIEYLDDAVKTPELVEQASGLHTLGAVTLAGQTGRSERGDQKEAGERLLVLGSANSPVSESFRILRTNVEFAQVDKVCRTLLVTSPNPGEGKSTVALNLATVIAQGGRRVLIVDADLRRPTLHRTFGVENRDGLTSLLVRDAHPLEEVVRPSPLPNLSLMTSGPIPPNPSELLGSARMSQLLERLLEQFDLVVLDTPPVLAVTDPIVLAARADGVVVVVDSRSTSTDALKRTSGALARASANVLGVVLNKLTARSGGYYYYRSYYGDDQRGSGNGTSSASSKVGVGT